MAGASMKDIKSRIKSVGSTMQITKAMELVASSKLRRAKERLERSRPFYQLLGEAIDIVESSRDVQSSVWSTPTEGKRTLMIVIAGDRGLAGGYNSNVFRLAESVAKKSSEITYLPIGKKAMEYCRHRELPIFSEELEYVDEVDVGASLFAAYRICNQFGDEGFDCVELVYTTFSSMLSQTPKHERLLPLERVRSKSSEEFDPIFAGDPDEILQKLIPEYVAGVIYSAVCESITSELGARRTAMDAANKNAGEIIDTLMLQYNRARQAAITQEITEIVSGAEAL